MLKLELCSILTFLSLLSLTMFSDSANTQPSENNQTGLVSRFSDAPRRPITQLEILFQQASKLAQEYRYLEAKEILTSIINADPNFADAYTLRAATLVLTKDRIAGSADLRKAAKLYKTQGQTELARQLLKQSIQLLEYPLPP
jgi:tetratricopeptide (TPR) repeat protein